MGVSVTFSLFFRNTPRGQTVQRILTQNGLIDVNSRTDVPFGEKIATGPRPPKPPKFAPFWSGQEIFARFRV